MSPLEMESKHMDQANRPFNAIKPICYNKDISRLDPESSNNLVNQYWFSARKAISEYGCDLGKKIIGICHLDEQVALY